jgi:hypothetical protein
VQSGLHRQSVVTYACVEDTPLCTVQLANYSLVS